MSTIRSKDRASLCSFMFVDGRKCRIPRSVDHPYLCAFHARKEAQTLAGEDAGKDIAYHLSASYVSACDLSSALGRLFSAVAQGQIKPQTATTLAYLGQTLVQALHLAQGEYINAHQPEPASPSLCRALLKRAQAEGRILPLTLTYVAAADRGGLRLFLERAPAFSLGGGAFLAPT